MFSVRFGENDVIYLTGRLDASSAPAAATELERISRSSTIDMGELEYISSAGLGVLFAVQKRLKGGGHGLKLVNLNSHIRDIFKFARFDLIFTIE